MSTNWTIYGKWTNSRNIQPPKTESKRNRQFQQD